MSWLTRSSVAGRMRAMNARPDSVLITH